MKLFCCFTPAHEVLYRDYFLPSVRGGFKIEAHPFAASGAGDFFSHEYLACLQFKVEVILRSLRENPGEALVWSDVDIAFVETGPEELRRMLLESGREVLFQREYRDGAEINTGFFVYRSGPELITFFERVLARLKADKTVHDQHVANELLAAAPAEFWGRLPVRYYARTHGWPPPPRIALYHANGTVGKDAVGQKIRQLEELRFLRRNRWVAIAWLGLRRMPRKLMRLARKRFARGES